MTDPIARTARYQDDLARLLAALEPAERAEVLDGVREHIDAALAELDDEPTDADVNRILGQLGSPGAVAEAAFAMREGPFRPDGHNSSLTQTPVSRDRLMSWWVPPLAMVLILIGFTLSVAFTPFLLLIAGLVILMASGLWTESEKKRALVAIGVGLVGFLLRPWVYGTNAAILGQSLGSALYFAIVAAMIVVVGVLWFRGSRRAREHASVASSL